MKTPTRLLEPRHFGKFHCLGADCEDTCCDGWVVTVDRPAYEKYQSCPDMEWRHRFEKLITINQSGATDHDYARIQLAATTCPFLSEGLCSIHKTWGESYLSVTCASFPRVSNVVDEVLEKSLDLGCPEAARVALLDPEPMAFETGAANGQEFSLARISAIDTAAAAPASKAYRQFHAVRSFVVGLLQNRAHRLWKRMLVLGLFCDKLEELSQAGGESTIADLIYGYQEALNRGMLEDVMRQLPPRPALRLETVLELVIARITSDFTNRRFLESYKQFMEGLQWGPDSTMEQIQARLTEAYTRYCGPFLETHEHLLEHYLVNYIYRSLFPFGPQESTYKLRDQNIDLSVHAAFLLLASYYAIIETLLTGLAAFHKEAFGAPHVIQVVYTFTRTFEHSLSFPERLTKTLVEKGMDNAAGMAVLIRN